LAGVVFEPWCSVDDSDGGVAIVGEATVWWLLAASIAHLIEVIGEQ
jgi:hypothetical protein